MSDTNIRANGFQWRSEAVEGLVDRVGSHFADDFEPPVPALMVPTALRAIELVVAGQPSNILDLPAGVLFQGKPTVEAQVVVDTLHLQHFVDKARSLLGLESAAVKQPTLFHS